VSVVGANKRKRRFLQCCKINISDPEIKMNTTLPICVTFWTVNLMVTYDISSLPEKPDVRGQVRCFCEVYVMCQYVIRYLIRLVKERAGAFSQEYFVLVRS
jgi:hypothetical protein